MNVIHSSIDGFDPLAADSENAGELKVVFEEASRRVVHNILKCYTGFYDVFSELIQNSLDAVQQKERLNPTDYTPTIWINIDIPSSKISIIDNGIGMSIDEFRFCLRPNVSFKRQSDLRGHKGVGATFLAYGFSFIKLQSKKNSSEVSAILRQGRQWAEDINYTVPRPKLEAIKFDVPELAGEQSGTSIEILIGQTPGERPKNLAWIGANSAEQWYNVLRIKTPLGGIYLSTPPFKPTIHITVISQEGNKTFTTATNPEFYYPHEIPNLKGEAVSDIEKAMKRISGDPSTVFTKLGSEYKRLDCIYDIWKKDNILEDNSIFTSVLDESERLLIEKHEVIIYGCFLRSAKIWSEFNDNVLKLRKGQNIIRGGLQMATDFMPQGDQSIIPLTSAIGYQANSHVIIHFNNGDPDMGRKTFQPELKELAGKLSVRVVNTFKKYLGHMKPDTGAKAITPDKELHDWKKEQEKYRENNPLSFLLNNRILPTVSIPQQEQDVVAIFHQLIGLDILKCFRFYTTSQSDRYDSLFFMDYDSITNPLYDSSNNRLGINRDFDLPYITEPKVLEYKYSFDNLIDDFEKEVKFSKQIDLVVCWTAGRNFKEKYFLQPYLIDDEGSSRSIYGSTHIAYRDGTQAEFEILVLKDLLSWLRDPSTEEARQKQQYRET